jgi:hypothetical protein
VVREWNEQENAPLPATIARGERRVRTAIMARSHANSPMEQAIYYSVGGYMRMSDIN